MATLENVINDDLRENGDPAAIAGDLTDLEGELKREKFRVKSNFTRSKNKILFLIDQPEKPSYREIQEACNKMDDAMEGAMGVMTKLSELFEKNKDKKLNDKIMLEIEKLDDEFSTTYAAAQQYIHVQKEQSSETSEILTIDLLDRMNISDQSETYGKGGYNVSEKVGTDDSCNINSSVPLKGSEKQTNKTNEYQKHATVYGAEPQQASDRDMPLYNEQSPQLNITVERKPSMNATATPFEPTATSTQPTIGQDLWRQLKRVQIPVFTGEKKNYQSWKASFLACIDSAPATAEYKLLQLRQYVSGEALKVIDNLGHSAAAYEAAKDRLERKFGGKRRQIALYLEELEDFPQIRLGHAKDIEEFADLLDIAMINLQEAGQHHELGVGSLFAKLQRKIPEAMLARYNRWVFEYNKEESVLSLREWILQESEFQTMATEAVRGLSGKSARPPSRPTHRQGNQRTFFGEATSGHNSSKKVPCLDCGKNHGIWKCSEFSRRTVADRWNFAKHNKLCFRCLAQGHQGKDCPRSRQCGQDGCTDFHHRLLHKNGSTRPTDTLPKVVENGTMGSQNRDHNPTEGKEQTTMVTQSEIKASFIGLRTVPVILKNGDRSLKINALLDDASTKSYVNADVAAELGLHGTTEKMTVNVLNGQVETFQTKPVNVELTSITGNVSTMVSACTVDRVTGNMPVVEWNKFKQQWSHLRNINFPTSATRPIVDMLLGLDCADLIYAIQEVRGKPGEPIARLTPLGWTCIGNPCPEYPEVCHTNFAYTYFATHPSETEKINSALKRFWEIEDVQSSHDVPIVRIEEQLALKTVEKSLTYENQMYRVGLPWKTAHPALPNNYAMALRRLENTEKRLKRSTDIASSYSQCIEQYIEKGYVKKIQEPEQSTAQWYLPHFPVLRPEKDTTKVRIVFDASARYENQSLNDVIFQGPKLQRDLFDVLLRFRRQPVAVVCDIAEMYLRIGIAHEDQPFHRFLWRGINQDRQPDIYQFDRVVFGVNSSPFQAQFVLQYHARKHMSEFPMAAETILRSTYMDDSMDSVMTEDEGIELHRQLSQLLTKAGMHARKWLSNSPRVLQAIPLPDRKSEVDLDIENLPSTKALGVWWIADRDVFTFRENAPSSEVQYTKRNFLKQIATLFDPIGHLAPFTVRAKMLLQQMWMAGLDWDEVLTEPLTNAARAWFSELPELTQLQIPRCLLEGGKQVDSVSLHTFVDASEDAFGAVAYVRYSYQDGTVSVNIVAAKTRVAPTTATSIPRLELMGAVIGVRLSTRIARVLELQMSQAVFWSDSQNVLWWIRGHSRDFKPFVANRVGEIQTSTSPEQWRYIPTNLNPADILSRGMKAADLENCDRWWKGPEFLSKHKETWPTKVIKDNHTGYDEMKRSGRPTVVTRKENGSNSVCMVVTGNEDNFPLEPRNYSSILRLKRVLAWINRFVNNSRKRKENRTSSELLSDELQQAEVQIIHYTQVTEFADEWKALSCGKPLPPSSKLLGLQPKLDDDGLMRSDGRLKHAQFLPYDVRHPIILPRRNWVTKLIVKEYHERGNHAIGTNQTLAALSTRYWLLAGREEIREWERECAVCRRRKSKPCLQIMAPLPAARLKPSLRAFSRSAVDFGGPFMTIQGRGKRREKRYLCLFTCLATRAVHLEMAYGLDTDSFLNAFYRMTSRRGVPEEMFSDNGTNFKGADAELKSLVRELDENKINQSIANKGITWHFNPPLAPHFGGVHEVMIKSAKKAIHAILGKADITDEELTTAMTGAEGLINSRPLTYQSANPLDEIPLTPNHFLHGQVGGQFAPTSCDETDFNPRKRWRRIQELVRHFWSRWMREWLPGLNARRKWFQTQRDVQIGDVMLVISPDTTRGNWPLGRVIEAYPGQDGHVRVVKIQVGEGTLIRPVTKLCPLELD